MKLKELVSYLDSAVPLSFQESYDNSGLQTGQPESEIVSALLTIDVTEEIADEAIRKGCNLIISHHPLIFNGINRISGRNFTERILQKCIKNDIAVYSAHTNLDISHSGVSRIMADKLGLQNIKTLEPVEKKLLKLVTYIPESHYETVSSAIFDAGAGVTGNYDRCAFSSEGTGSFRGNAFSNPFVGEKEKIHFEKEKRFETILFSYLRDKVIMALLEAHPYEEVAYDLYRLENKNIDSGLGCIGNLPAPMDEADLLRLVCTTFDAKGIRYSKLLGRKASKIALCGGSGSSLIKKAILSGADVFITGDIKYHSFFEADHNILLIDAGHFETEKFAVEILKDLVIKKFPKFALRFSEINTNPINYL